ncbi:MAG: MoxR family ATPase [Clostridiaceae bacterium]|jgi:MoxR-like ATPase|nr:MoxR family ATPase [Bacillota bacterium]NLN51335.1 MoxR family ATPase [Clostridiaceae bacterium]
MNIQAQTFKELCNVIEQNINRVMIGKEDVIESLLIALAAGGHVLIEDVPGIGKTTLVSALAKSLNLTFKRIQFTPDLMPSDVTGFSLYNQKTGEFEFQPGAVMSQIVLADEINRTSPKTQSALLEVMQENQVTVDGITYEIPQPFIVLATQNPVDHIGTYPLPEAQLDRFMLKIDLGYPTIDQEVEILDLYSSDAPLETLQEVADSNDVLWMREQALHVHCAKSVKRYIAELTAATRRHPDISLGASPRASNMLMQAAKSRALIRGRDYVRPDDVQALAVSVLSHRITITPESRLKRITSDDAIISVVRQVAVPER